MNYVQPNTGKLIMLTLIGLVVITPAARWVGKRMGKAQNAREAASPYAMTQMSALSTKPPIMVVNAYSQSADGNTINDMDLAFLHRYEVWVLDKTKKHAIQRGLDASIITASAAYVLSGSQKFAVAYLSDGMFTSTAVIFGIKESQAIRVTCAVGELADVEIMSGPCNDKVRQIFGTPLNSADVGHG